jgi:hypothetical protein
VEDDLLAAGAVLEGELGSLIDTVAAHWATMDAEAEHEEDAQGALVRSATRRTLRSVHV